MHRAKKEGDAASGRDFKTGVQGKADGAFLPASLIFLWEQ